MTSHRLEAQQGAPASRFVDDLAADLRTLIRKFEQRETVRATAADVIQAVTSVRPATAANLRIVADAQQALADADVHLNRAIAQVARSIDDRIREMSVLIARELTNGKPSTAGEIEVVGSDSSAGDARMSAIAFQLTRSTPSSSRSTRICGSCSQPRPPVEMVDDVCVDCANDAEDAEAIVPILVASATPADAAHQLRMLANRLDEDLPFTPLAFGVISRAVIALLAVAHPALDVYSVTSELDETVATMDGNAAELADWLRSQLEVPTVKYSDQAA